MKISEVVIPAAGLGTRFLPYTKACAKEMLPIINKPAIEYIAQEAIDSGIRDFFLITSKTKKAISDYFSHSIELNKTLDKDKIGLLDDIDKIIENANFSYINQESQLGLGHAILMAKSYIKNKYFSVMLPDDIIKSDNPALKQLIKIAIKQNASVIAVQEVPRESLSSYGIIKIEKQVSDNLYQISDLVEKPNINDAPSNLGIIGRYVLSNNIFQSLEQINVGIKNELQLTDAINHLLKNGQKVFAYKTSGSRFDIGTPIGWLEANIKFALENPNYSKRIKEFLG